MDDRVTRRSVLRRPYTYRGARRAAVGRGPDGPVDARREPDEVAPRAHDVVLRDVRARRHRPRRALRRGVRLPVQLLLRARRPAVRASRAAGCSRGPAPPRSAATARHVDARVRDLIADGLDERHDELVVLGLHHEQQHQELLLMDIKHVLVAAPPAASPTPSAARVPPCRSAASGRTPRRSSSPAASSRSVPTARRLLLRQRAPSPPFLVGARRARRAAGQLREYLAFIDDGGYARPELWLSEGWATVSAQRWRAPLYWETRRRRVVALHAARHRGRRARRPGEPRELLRGRRLRPVARRAAPHRGRVGARREGHTTDVRPSRSSRRRHHVGTGVLGSAGSGRRARTRPIRGSGSRRRGRRVQRQVHGQPAGPARRRAHHPRAPHPGRPTATSSPPSARWPFAGLRLAHDAP